MRKILVDTHTLLWFVEDDDRLSSSARHTMLQEIDNLHISSASFWEISIKLGLGKLNIKSSFDELYEYVISDELHLLNFDLESYKILISLPFHHRDPFDRMIISQAKAYEMPIISKDEAFDSYGVQRIF